MEPPVLCTVSTVKDTPSNLDQFVDRNLRSGANHMFVFLDADDPESEALLRGREHVTVVRTDDAYWAGARPDELTERQVVNANLVNSLVALLPSVDWLAHLDGDECLELDGASLAGLSADVRALRLATREAVSTEHGTRDVTLFKKKLQPGRLQRLVRMGLLPEPSNRLWIKGYLHGKSMVRPGLDLGMGIHRASWRDGSDLEHFRSPEFRVLHYDCVSFEEFVRKWTSHVNGGSTQFRDERLALFRDFERLARDPALDEDVRRDAFLALYRERVEDQVDRLVGTPFLEELDEAWHAHEPRRLPEQDSSDLEKLLPLLASADKRLLLPRLDPAVTIQEVRRVGEGTEHRLRHRIDAAAADAAERLASAGHT